LTSQNRVAREFLAPTKGRIVPTPPATPMVFRPKRVISAGPNGTSLTILAWSDCGDRRADDALRAGSTGAGPSLAHFADVYAYRSWSVRGFPHPVSVLMAPAYARYSLRRSSGVAFLTLVWRVMSHRGPEMRSVRGRKLWARTLGTPARRSTTPVTQSSASPRATSLSRA